ncbi:MAG: hypothetical protein RLZZ241_857 [Bacteroidota bacterium]|jgi:hypothetical protein
MKLSRYLLLMGLCGLGLAQAQEIQLDFQKDGVLLSEGSEKILFYQTAPKDYNGRYARSNYIHPLYALDGTVITEDFPEDHLHHRGIFWAWHQLYVGDVRIGDGWEIQNFSWQVQKVSKMETPDAGKGIQSQVFWKSPLWLNRYGQEIPLVAETTTIIAYPKADNYRIIDITVSLIALEPNMRIGGSEDEKGYGGFSYRIRMTDDTAFAGPNGPVLPEVLPVATSGWMDMTGSIGLGSSKVGIAVLSHPQNPGYPNPWILRSSASMQNAVYPYPGAQAVALSPDIPTVLKYRVLIHEGLSSQEIQSLYTLYTGE